MLLFKTAMTLILLALASPVAAFTMCMADARICSFDAV
jgi:hypothetical protein